MTTLIGKQAVVVGAGMGGLTAARALANHFERVLMLERDALPEEARDRAGVPQGKHVHLLLAGGQRALSELFSGFEDDLLRVGAVPIRMALDLRSERPGFVSGKTFAPDKRLWGTLVSARRGGSHLFLRYSF